MEAERNRDRPATLPGVSLAASAGERSRLHRARRLVEASEPEPPPAPEALDLLHPSPAPSAPALDEPYSEWADRTLKVTAGASRGQPWQTMAWQREPVDLAGRGGRIVVLRAAAQTGKSTVGLTVAAGRLLRGEPVTIVAPNARPSGATFARERLEPMLGSPPIVGHLHEARGVGGLGRSSALTYRTLDTGGSISLAGAESPAQLASRGCSALILDEVARYPLQCGREGPPVMVALERTQAWRETRAVIIPSTPVTEGDELDVWYSSGDQRQWFVTCGCGNAWSPIWADIDNEAPAVVCPACGRRYADGPDRVALLEAGEWRPTAAAEDSEVVSFHLPRWLSPASTLAECVSDRRRAERRRTLAVWTRTCAALPAEPDQDLPDVSGLEARREGWPDGWPPDEVALTVAGVDCQSNRLEVLLLGMPADRAWGAVTDYRIIRGRPQEAAPWRELQKVLDVSGVRLCAVDAGYQPEPVRALARRDRRIVPVRGMAGVRLAIGHPTAAGWCFTVGSDGVKRDGLSKVDSGWLRIPAAPWATVAWLHGLTAEHEEVVERSGRRVTVWKQHYRRNEPLDTLTYALAVSELVPRPAARRRLTYRVG